jgi:hypothetical protein
VVPGVIVVWSGNAPRFAAHRIPFVFGRDHADASDERISRQHVHLRAGDRCVTVTDLGSRNGTYANGRAITAQSDVWFPGVIRAGRTVAVALDDIRPFENVQLERRGKAVVGGTLAPACSAIDQAAIEEENIAIFGSLHVGIELAKSYGGQVGGNTIVVELDIMTTLPLAEKLVGTVPPRTMILVLRRPLCLPDLPELAQWLETDVRILCVARDRDAFKFMPDEIKAKLMPRRAEIPAVRYDELAATISDLVTPKPIHATLIEFALLQMQRMNEEQLLRYITDYASGRDQLTGDGLSEYIAGDRAMRDCVAAGIPRRR